MEGQREPSHSRVFGTFAPPAPLFLNLEGDTMGIREILAPQLPYLRRYARALTGSQAAGDAYVRAALNALLAGDAELESYLTPRVALYRLFHTIWARRADLPNCDRPLGEEGVAAGANLRRMTASARSALLLTAVEAFSITEAAYVLQEAPEDVEAQILEAQDAIERRPGSRILIIEDEAIIALDLASIVKRLGHDVAGVASSRSEAVSLAYKGRPDLILADIDLGAGGSGLEAVVEILRSVPVPVIFVTANPEALLTGERPEPTHLITKPFVPETLQATIGQVLFLRSLNRDRDADGIADDAIHAAPAP
jgi:CheY-like chemotaxis protein